MGAQHSPLMCRESENGKVAVMSGARERFGEDVGGIVGSGNMDKGDCF